MKQGTLSVLATALLALLCPSNSFAQDTASWPPFRDVQLRNQCRFVRQVLTTGHPAHKRGEALGVLPRCGPVAGQIVAEVLVTSRAVTSPDSDLDELITAVWGLRDQALLDAGLRVAQDASASAVARIEALRLVLAQIDPDSPVQYRELTRETVEESTVLDWPVREGTPLPPDYLTRISQAMDGIVADATTPARVSSIAGQIGYVARRRLTPPGR